MNQQRFIEMLQYRRPEGTDTQKEFCDKFLKPVYGEPDIHGNYIHFVKNSNGTLPRTMFSSHHDTVHHKEGLQKLSISHDRVRLMEHPDNDYKECLGADCTTGIFIMDEMIKAKVPGIYVVHAAEEIGCVGSSALVKDMPFWLHDGNVQACIAFDRFGTTSVITHQMGRRTASEAFAQSFADAVDMPQLVSDDGGSYTDSNEYADIVSECTNISVGYYSQHTSKENQDLVYLKLLIRKLIAADWSKLVCERDPAVVEYDDWGWGRNSRGFYGGSRLDYTGTRNNDEYWNGQNYVMGRQDKQLSKNNYELLLDLILSDPYTVAHLLDEWGISEEDLVEAMYGNANSPGAYLRNV